MQPRRERNPYRPGVGLAPKYLAGRDAEQRRFRATLGSAPDIPANIRLTGLRGVGKTVLLSRFREIAEENLWTTLSLELEPRHNRSSAITATLTDQARSLRERLSALYRVREHSRHLATAARQAVTVEYEGLTWSLSGDVSGDAASLITSLAETIEASEDAGRTGLAVLIDEAQILSDEKERDGEHPLSLLIAAVSALQKQQAPIALVLCGLPTLAVNLLNARTYSERMFKGEIIEALGFADAKQAFLEPINSTSKIVHDDLVERVLQTVDGYPYFIQLWGAELWDAAAFAGSEVLSVELLEATEPEIYRRLDFDFYEPRVASLTPAEQDLLTDAGQCPYPPLIVADVGRQSVKKLGNINVLLGRLVQANVLYRPRKGQYLYTAPGFHDYLQRRSSRS